MFDLGGYNPRNAILKPNIDVDIPPIHRVTLSEWNQEFEQLNQQESKIPRNIFALTGVTQVQIDGQYQKRRLGLDVSTCEVPWDMQLEQRCDIDSVIGMTQGRLPIKPAATLDYYPLPDARFTLENSLHIPGPDFVVQEDPISGLQRSIPLHRIPNARFGEVGPALIRVFFPELMDDQANAPHPNAIGGGVLQPFYDYAIRPAAEDAEIPNARSWPPRYSDEMFRAGNGGSLPQQSSLSVLGWYVAEWVKGIREATIRREELSRHRNFFFVIELRGMKSSTMHTPPVKSVADEDGIADFESERMKALVNLLSDWNLDDIESPQNWYIDIATTINAIDSRGVPVCLFPRADRHTEIIRHFTGSNISTCSRWVDARPGSGPYIKDEISHLGFIAGLRLDLHKEEPTPEGVHYFHLYSTEKSITYRVDKSGKAKRTSPRLILDDWLKQRRDFFVPKQEAFVSASRVHDAAVRAESRVNLCDLPMAHMRIEGDDLRNWFVQVENQQYWGFKANRSKAISSTLDRILKARRELSMRSLIEVGTTIVLLSYMENSLSNRPDDGGRWDEVRDVGLVHLDTGFSVIPDRSMPYYALHSLRIREGQESVSRLRILSAGTLCHAIDPSRKPPMTLIEVFRAFTAPVKPSADYTTEGMSWGADDEPPLLRSAHPASNRQRHVRIQLQEEAPDVFSQVISDLESALPQGDNNSEEEDPEEGIQLPAISQQVSAIVHNYPVQVFAKAPNNKDRRSCWCILDPEEKSSVTTSIFRQDSPSQLARIFLGYTDLGYDLGRWNATIEAWFPDLSRIEHIRKVKIQGLVNLGCWQDWEMVLMQVPVAQRDTVIRYARAYATRNWFWLPAMARNKLWLTGMANIPANARFVGDAQGGPWIVRNPQARSLQGRKGGPLTA